MTTLIERRCFYVRLVFGWKEEHQVPSIIRDLVAEMAARGEVSGESGYASLRRHGFEPGFRFVLLQSRLSDLGALGPLDRVSVRVYRFLKSIGLSSSDEFGLDSTNSVQEEIPIHTPPKQRRQEAYSAS